ncbi:DODA-type extradiol aromatic ring-opening family dioxygenase [Massilia cavernae]|uniref:Dioxygenase n=1 Tax=Massilia cavernae TaxID=2320864 RepID=A0A418XRH6_9BURK|nr:class III extradiol ring-cleavage dioxygenase [Massilia cavernae]RJG15105.1 dioxygenase [Massilia cavernae]
MPERLPTYFLSHGGGPWPFMKEQYGSTYDVLEASLKDIPRQVGAKPAAVLVVSGHWEEREFTLSSGREPGMIYDYGGFPAHTYRVQYKAPGAPEVAERAAALLAAAGQAAELDPVRGFDHGTFSMLYPVYPKADVPVVQMALKHGLDPLAHLEAGRALAPLREEGVLIIGSGLSFHNLRQFGPAGRQASHAFDAWLRFALLDLPPEQRTAALLHWDQAPYARMAHPREEHLIPLLVAYGAAEHEPAARVYHEEEFFGNLAVSSYRFGEAAAP